MCSCLSLPIPNTQLELRPGARVKLGRFQSDYWVVGFGWFSYAGNRPMCGWYMTNESTADVKPIFETDLVDIYVITN